MASMKKVRGADDIADAVRPRHTATVVEPPRPISGDLGVREQVVCEPLGGPFVYTHPRIVPPQSYCMLIFSSHNPYWYSETCHYCVRDLWVWLRSSRILRPVLCGILCGSRLARWPHVLIRIDHRLLGRLALVQPRLLVLL